MRRNITLDYDGMRHACVHGFWRVHVDHLVLTSVCLLPAQIWVRNYQILEQQPETAKEAHQAKITIGLTESTSLVEVGPRFVLAPIRIFRGSFGGQTLFQNPDFVSPNEIRAQEKEMKGHSYDDRKESQKQRKERKSRLVLPTDPLDSVFR